ncbi:2-oxo-4-hydroxy-4-carboxy-5-ureidoimidazoline decarboxylase [Dactylosporangium sp. AC04546]|uniref:2-oxo-4-hydroxy-4-carboxy-5-ureidoimidazoline decarboxylase n=1 Tax=Dactylosporangium sp. AC04546 TaxID=2862460 RepID=UPI001EDFF109|nr:2-oxo-4-hydroxy-4-carboxy-5-ureidoimidazoline decarboxylase [Dactylosporangium sp. AC04546]WVK85943.1 2-oxo-4-hydroxy-4-carboxy-5-ureidoimidazoline decarboxylase [Dactylosporangium sp. AC04546]
MLDRFNDLAPEAAAEALLACCASPGWAARVAAGRPYPTSADLVVAGVAAFDDLGWTDLRQALDAHPRIGEKPAGEQTEAAWSRHEQSGVWGAEDELRSVNRAYEERFGHLFLIFASGRSADEILVAARGRLGNDDETERTVVRGELRKIVELRLERLVTP